MPDETPVEVAPETTETPLETAAPTQQAPQYVTYDQFKGLESALSQVAQALMQRPAQPVPQTTQEVSDQELYTLATQGNQEAFRLLQERQADRVVTKRLTESERRGRTEAQLRELYAKYPELSQSGHVMNTRLGAFYQALTRMGDPESQETHLQAALRAVAESRDVITQRPTQPARNVAAGQIAPQGQRPAATPALPTVTAEEVALAQKMGIKDPAKAKAKFWERNQKGQSRVSPTIAAALGNIE